MGKYLFVRWNLNNLLSQMVKSEGFDYVAAYKGGKSKVLSIVREIWFKLGVPFKYIWYNDNIKDYKDTIIINDAMMTVDYLQWIKDRNPDARLIFWYWNNITERVIQPDVVRPLGYELWSYSERDCEKYGLRYNTTFYSQKYYEQCNVKKTELVNYDISFVGKDKGRMQIIEDLQEKVSLKIDAYYVADHFYEFYKNKAYHTKSLSYAGMLKRYMDAKAILDIVVDTEGGLTLRNLDGVYYGKKVVTNNVTVKNYDFYHPDNFFILGIDSIDKLEEFLDAEYHEVDKEIVEYYQMSQWIKRFE